MINDGGEEGRGQQKALSGLATLPRVWDHAGAGTTVRRRHQQLSNPGPPQQVKIKTICFMLSRCYLSLSSSPSSCREATTLVCSRQRSRRPQFSLNCISSSSISHNNISYYFHHHHRHHPLLPFHQPQRRMPSPALRDLDKKYVPDFASFFLITWFSASDEMRRP